MQSKDATEFNLPENSVLVVLPTKVCEKVLDIGEGESGVGVTAANKLLIQYIYT